MAEKEVAPQRWEIILSGAATFMLTLAAIFQEDLATLAKAAQDIGAKSTPWWLSAMVSIPAPVYWVVTLAAGAGLFWLCLRLSRRWGAPVLYLPPVVMLALPYVMTWLVYAPVRAVTGGAKF